MSEGVSPEMARAALEWQAQEATAARATAEAVAELTADATPPGAKAPASPAPDVRAEARAQLANLVGVAWTVADRLVQEFGGKHLALQPDEREQLIAATVPVAEKYLPPDLSLPPEAMLALTAGIIYGPKLMAGPPKPAPATPEASS